MDNNIILDLIGVSFLVLSEDNELPHNMFAILIKKYKYTGVVDNEM